MHAGRVNPTCDYYVCLTPALSWLYPAHTGHVSSFPEALWNLEASDANGTVSPHSVCLKQPSLTWGEVGGGEGGVPSSTRTVYQPNTCSHHEKKPNMCSTDEALIPIGKLGEGNSASMIRGERTKACSWEVVFFLPVHGPLTPFLKLSRLECGIPLGFLFPPLSSRRRL